MKKRIKKSLKTSNGITLIALVITIIVLLILAGISISMLSGNNSILQRATDAKEQTGVGQEKETIALAYNSALAKKVSNGNSSAVTDSELNDELDNSDATASGNAPIIIEFTNGHKYSIDNSGNIRDYTPSQSNGKLISELFETDGNTEGKMHLGDYINYPVNYDNVPAYVKSDWADQISGYSSIQDFVNDDEVKKYIASDSYQGWKLLSVGENNGNTIIKLISAGVPLNYLFQNGPTVGMEDLTVGFFDTQIISGLSDYGFYNIGFKSQNGIRATNMDDVKALFDNSYTEKYQNGEIATYTNIKYGQTTNTVTNENVAGYPKVQSITQEEEDTTATQIIACQGEFSEYSAPVWYPSYAGMSMGGGYLAYRNRTGQWRDNDGTMKCLYGVRVVVTLKSDVKFTLSNESTSTDTIKTWNLE